MDRPAPLVSGEWLEARLGDPGLRIVEVAADPEGGAYREGHIPGARFAYWKTFCWHPTDRELVTPAEMGARLGAMGIGPGETLVIYGDPVQYGTYAFWALTLAGHERLRLLDGARTRWVADGRPLDREVPAPEPVDFPPGHADPSSRIGRDDVRSRLADPGRLLLDFRSPEEYRGERVMEVGSFDHGAERKGRIPGARHLYFRRLLAGDDTFETPDRLRSEFAAAGVGPGAPGEIVNYCRLSHRATLGWFAMRFILGMDNVRVYDGSWTEWGSIVGFPVEA